MVTLAERRLSDAGPLRHLADAIAAAVEQRDGGGYIEADRAFHLALVSRVNNAHLTKMVMELRDGMRLYGMETPAGRDRQCRLGRRALPVDRPRSGGRHTEGIGALISRHILDWEPVFTAALSDRLNSNQLRSRGR